MMRTKLAALLGAVACAACTSTGMPITNLRDLQSIDLGSTAKQFSKVNEATRDFTQPEEIALGQGIASNVLGTAPLLQDRKAQRYVGSVGRWLAMQTERQDLPWHFAVLDDKGLNAFAAPGGYIFITKGLLLSLKNEAELAGILAHEIAHVVRKHQLNAIRKAASQSHATEFAGMMLTAKSQNGALLSKVVAGGIDIFAKGLDKEEEYEADRMGVVIAARAGYDVYGLPAALQTLQAVNPDSDAIALMFKTHPSFTSRLERLDRVLTRSFDRFDQQPTLAARYKASVPGR
ncbi:M48 family metalloprotease [Massilia glaciei]|uniref:Peptidase M48 n=1 Tax=Massilia glaciei TaxID=1524097 RepID=A0A2U2I7H5_9BURK|nr:M48 family metalloprotease [Massilia glaciei]PWF55619.1 peptidase M48 [Massilia glaciei]